ncbi:hypothetical protein TRAPUB_3386 [Trametes pubescens]|uniref:HMG box domain-containing protein n=1 Tax=Trametes pubescens TaxID=154538 RepID=A0A1M2VE04_TRAPU|nr:hypothetical protein TRAPUB_3386 [Trametes pubescens]
MPPTRTKQTDCEALAPTNAPSTATAHDVTFPAANTKATKVKRPLNPFMIYRKDCVKQLKRDQPEIFPITQPKLSSIIGLMWKSAPADVRQLYEAKAVQALKEHMALYPDYTYRPRSKAQKAAEKKEAAQKRQAATAGKTAAPETSARAPRGPKAAAEADAPLPGPSQVAAPRRASTRRSPQSQTSASSTSAEGPSRLGSQGTVAFLGAGAPPLLDSDVDSTLSPSPLLSYDGETLRCLPFPLQATAITYAPAPVQEYLQHAAPSAPQALDAYHSLPELVQGSSPQASDGAFFPSSAMALPTLPSGSNPYGLLREWSGVPPRDFFDPVFPAHLPLAGSVEPINFQDVTFALNSAQSNGVAWVSPSPQLNVDMDLSSLSPTSVYDYPTANENNTLAPAMDMSAVYQAVDQFAANASSPYGFEDAALDQSLQEAIAFAEPCQPQSSVGSCAIDLVHHAASPGSTFAEPQQHIEGETGQPERFIEALNEIDRVFATLVVPMEPTL